MREDVSSQQLGDATHAIGAHAALRVFDAARWLFGGAVKQPLARRVCKAVVDAVDRNTPRFVWAFLHTFVDLMRRMVRPDGPGNAARWITLATLSTIAAVTWLLASLIPRTADGGVASALEIAGIVMLSVSVSMMILIAIILGLIMVFVVRL
jgi:hypothetical protein